jgi:hypothetical protein
MLIRPFRTLPALAFFLLSLIACSKSGSPDEPTINEIVITEISPTHGPAGTIERIIGKGFDQIPTIDSVLINSRKLKLISRKDTEVVVEIPQSTGTGLVQIWYKGKKITGPVFNYDSVLMVTTIAGDKEAGARDGQGLDARFDLIIGIDVDRAGNIYAADWRNGSIRKITASGLVTTLAGPLQKYTYGYVDDTGSAARFSEPTGLKLGPDGNLYVGERQHIRKVSMSGIVNTYAGRSWNRPENGTIDGHISVATFSGVSDLVFDEKGNMFASEQYNDCIRKITPDGYVSRYAGLGWGYIGHADGPLGTNRFEGPIGVAVLPSGDVYAIDGQARQYLRKVTPGGMTSTFLGPYAPDITGTNDLFQASAVAADKKGNLYFAVSYGIIRMSPDGKFSRFAAGGIGEIDGPVSTATFRYITNMVADDSGNIYLADYNRIRKIWWK